MTAVLVAVVIAFLVAASANWWSAWTRNARVSMLSKPSATILAIAVALVAGQGGDRPSAVTWLTVVALVFCLVGDIALMPEVDKFVVGLGSFLVGHLVFIVAMAAGGLDAIWMVLIALAVLGPLLMLVAPRIIGGAKEKEPELVGPVIAYLTVITAMALVAWCTGNAWAVAGATAFVVSDSILGWRKFVDDRRWMGVGIMVTYHLALLGLALAAG